MNDVTQLTGSPVMWLFSGLIVAAAISFSRRCSTAWQNAMCAAPAY